jgi:hypothetical protein
MFVRRFTSIPTLEVIRSIEGVCLVDLAPPAPGTGVGTGVVLLVGEFEDGYFATDAEAKGGVEIFGGGDFLAKFGGFGFTYDNVIANHPCGRRHGGECWNGNGWLKAYKLKCQRLIVSRVDTSVGEVSFSPMASIDGDAGPFALAVGMTLSVTTNTGTAACTALAAAVAHVDGTGGAFGTVAAGDSFNITVDELPTITVVLAATDTTVSAVVAKINATVGITVASVDTADLDLDGQVKGTAGKIVLANVTTGCLAKLGLTAATTNGTGDFPNIEAATAAQVAALISASSTLGAINCEATVGPEGVLRVYEDAGGAPASIMINTGVGGMAAALGLTIGTAVTLADHDGGTIPAGTRVYDASTPTKVWVTMQTLDAPAGDLGPFDVKVRPALDDGTATGASAAAIDTIADQPSWGALTVTNASALASALSEAAIDAAYSAALAKTLDLTGAVKDAGYLLMARRSDAVVRAGKSNAMDATANGCKARKLITGSMIATTASAAITEVASFRSDRVLYTTKGLKIYIPEIATRGTDGGIGFTSDGIISVRPDGPLTTICASRPPEENPGQQTNLVDDFFEVDAGGETLALETYQAWKAAGICAPIIDGAFGTMFQSGVTTSLETAKITAARRKMADFIDDSIVELGKPYCKQLTSQSRRDALRGAVDSFLGGLLSVEKPASQRINSFSVDDTAAAGNTADVLALGAYYMVIRVRTLSSMDYLVFQVEAGENAITVQQAA